MSTCLSPPSTPAHRLPGPPRRPSALRRSSSSSSANSFVLHSVPRFSPDPVSSYLPPPVHDLGSDVALSQQSSATPATSQNSANRSDVIDSNFVESRTAAPGPSSVGSNEAVQHAARSVRAHSVGGALAGRYGGRPAPPRHAQSIGPGPSSNVPQPATTTSSSLLQRRKSSSSSAGRPAMALALSELESKLPTLKVPSPPLAKIPVDSLDKLDDTIPKTVIGESSAAVTPALSDGNSPQDRFIVERPFRSTKSIVRTPFPERTSFIDDEDEENEEEEEDGVSAAPKKSDPLVTMLSEQ
ncbi:hypothetical protein OIV83_005426 [Microbotryomycetes sp. JL201]|nr:hypothetical protein OIV83_005426 [Microbotryomycetes sp. JL201]